MLAAGVEHVAEHGLSLSLEHLNLEELIATAGVSRTSTYRRWPTKDAFAADLLLRIARDTQLTDLAPIAESIRSIPARTLALDTEQARRDAIVEIFRVLTDADFAAALGSTTWRSYLTLRAAHPGLPDGDLRAHVRVALDATERRFTEHRSAVLGAAASLMGYRLRDSDAFGWHTLAESLNATFSGLLIKAFADTDAATRTRQCAPFGSSRPAAWSLVALASGSHFFGALEPDPAITWDTERERVVTQQLTDLDTALAAKPDLTRA